MKKTGESLVMKKVIALSAVLVMGALGMACGDAATNTANTNKAVANAMNSVANAANAAANGAQTAANQMANTANAMANAANTMKPANTMAPSNSSNGNGAMKPANK